MIKLTVLGACGTFPAAGRACSGYLVEAEDAERTASVWIDCGSGTLANLLRYTTVPDLALAPAHGPSQRPARGLLRTALRRL
jgi:ribonuclease BN (tRNA processing enzyme)